MQKLIGVKYTSSTTASPNIPTEGLLIAGFLPGSGWNGTSITFQWSPAAGGTFYDVKETDGSAVTYTVAASKLTRVDPSGWAFASTGWIKIISGTTEDTASEITVLLRSS